MIGLSKAETARTIEYLRGRGVQHFVHFTPADNLQSILSEGILSREALEKTNLSFVWNDEYRFDGKDSVNLSITNPNIKMFYRFRKQYPERPYAIALIDISILEKYPFGFVATNAASQRAISCNVEELFEGDRLKGLEDNWPTDNQAEVLIEDTIAPNYISEIHFPQSAREYWEQMKPVVERNGLHCELVLCDRLFNYNKAPLGEDAQHETFKYYVESWKADIQDYDAAEKAIAEFEWITAFDSMAVHIDDLETFHNQINETHQSVARWQMKYYHPGEAKERDDSSLSAIAVLEKIIHRGRLTILSNELESSIAKGEPIQKAHQIQSALVELVKRQKLSPGMTLAFVNEEKTNKAFIRMAVRAVEDIKELSDNISRMYACEDFLKDIDVTDSIDNADMIISWAAARESLVKKTAVIEDIRPNNREIDVDFTRVQNPVDIKIDPDILKYLLNYIYRFDDFRENQIDGILRGLRRMDSIVLLPTGSGKSIVYQLLSLITPGISFVVSPIISLIDDQIANLYSKGIDRIVGLSSMMEQDERNKAIAGLSKGQHLMCYVAPERFQNKSFIDAVAYYARTNIISVIAIDEAHCVSEWGHDFRTSYLGLAKTCRHICKTGEAVPPLLALTGTASASVLRDMQHDLDIMDDFAIIQPDSFDRSEIRYRIVGIESENKRRELEEIIQRRIPADFAQAFGAFYDAGNGEETNCGIVFCQNVNGSFGLMASEKQLKHGHHGVWDIMNTILPGKCGMYSGKRPERWTGQNWDTGKREYATQFKNNQSPVIVTTKAFGMGIDKPNVRWVIHYGLPSSLEAYYQEVGRAARDRRTAYAYLILSDDFPSLNREILNPADTGIETIEAKESLKGRWKGDDISRTLFFHTRTFDGIKKEMERAKWVLNMCNADNWVDKQWRVQFANDSKTEIEKAVYRLQLLGVFESYTVDYGAHQFVINAGSFEREELIQNYIEYIKSYQSDAEYLKTSENSLRSAVQDIDEDHDFIIKVTEHLLKEFTYKVIEEGRRRATLNILEAASEAAASKNDDEADRKFRNRLLAYLSTDKKQDGDKGVQLEDIINNATDTGKILRILETYLAQDGLEFLIGQTSRQLEAYPQHYGLHLLQSFGYFLLDDVEKSVEAFQTAVGFGIANYGIDKGRVEEDLVAFLNNAMAVDTSAEKFHAALPRLCDVLGASVDSVLSELTSPQAEACRKVNHMYSLIMNVRRSA